GDEGTVQVGIDGSAHRVLDKHDTANYKNAMARLSRYSLDDLANETGLSPRTIRHYIAQDLLPGPESLGRNAWYSEDHLDRLKCIQILKDRTGAALADLRPVINSLPEEQIRDIAAGREQGMAVPVGSSLPMPCRISEAYGPASSTTRPGWPRWCARSSESPVAASRAARRTIGGPRSRSRRTSRSAPGDWMNRTSASSNDWPIFFDT